MAVQGFDWLPRHSSGQLVVEAMFLCLEDENVVRPLRMQEGREKLGKKPKKATSVFMPHLGTSYKMPS